MVKVMKLSETNWRPHTLQLSVCTSLMVLPLEMVTEVGAVAEATGIENMALRGCEMPQPQFLPHWTKLIAPWTRTLTTYWPVPTFVTLKTSNWGKKTGVFSLHTQAQRRWLIVTCSRYGEVVLPKAGVTEIIGCWIRLLLQLQFIVDRVKSYSLFLSDAPGVIGALGCNASWISLSIL